MRLPIAISALLAGAAGGLIAPALAQVAPKAADPNAPASNLDYWLGQAETPASAPASQPASQPAQPDASESLRADALPGAVRLSDGRTFAGRLYTTRGKPWQVWNEDRQRWQRVPFLTVLSISAVVVEAKLEPKWRWKAMGEPERVYTGESYPTLRLGWRFELIDGTTLTGAVKGQPIWLDAAGRQAGPFILHERMKGKVGQTLDDLVHLQRLVVSRRTMQQVLAAGAEAAETEE